MSIIKWVLGVLILVCCINGFAADGARTGKVGSIIAQTQNGGTGFLHFSLVPAQTMCGHQSSSVILYVTDPNYQTMVNILLAARMADKPVTILSNQKDATNCKIESVLLQ